MHVLVIPRCSLISTVFGEDDGKTVLTGKGRAMGQAILEDTACAEPCCYWGQGAAYLFVESHTSCTDQLLLGNEFLLVFKVSYSSSTTKRNPSRRKALDYICRTMPLPTVLHYLVMQLCRGHKKNESI